jgi:hypothetical protein
MSLQDQILGIEKVIDTLEIQIIDLDLRISDIEAELGY